MIPLPALKSRGFVNLVEPGRLHPAVSFARASTATYVGADGLLKTAAANTPRFDYDPLTLALRGLLVEEQRTNLLLRSTLAGGGDPPTGWVKPISTGTSAPVASIYGNADGAVAYSQAATAQRPFYEQVVATTVGVVYTLSLRVEAVSGLIYNDIIGINGITPSTIRRNGVTVSAADAAQPGLVECVFTAAGTSSGIRIGIGVAGNATGSATFSRPQLEAGSFATSYIPTTGTAQTRAADDPRVSTLASIGFNASASSLFVEAECAYVDAGAQVGALFELFGGSTNYVRFYLDARGARTGQPVALVRNSTQVELAGDIFQYSPPLTQIRVATAYDAATSAMCTNGVSVVEAISPPLLPAPTILHIGRQNATPATTGSYWLRRMRYYPRRLTNADLQGITA